MGLYCKRILRNRPLWQDVPSCNIACPIFKHQLGALSNAVPQPKYTSCRASQVSRRLTSLYCTSIYGTEDWGIPVQRFLFLNVCTPPTLYSYIRIWDLRIYWNNVMLIHFEKKLLVTFRSMESLCVCVCSSHILRKVPLETSHLFSASHQMVRVCLHLKLLPFFSLIWLFMRTLFRELLFPWHNRVLSRYRTCREAWLRCAISGSELS